MSGSFRRTFQRRLRALPAIAAVALVAGSMVPLVWVVVASLRPEAELFGGARAAAGGFGLHHYRALFGAHSFWVPLGNSLLVATATTLLCVPAGALTAYAIVRLRFRGKHLLLGLFLVASMVPQIAIVSPLYLILRRLGLIDTYPGLVLPYVTFAMPLCVWLLVGSLRQLPRDLEEAALVDGATRLQALRRIVLPLWVPSLVTTAILTFIYCWNEFLLALSLTTSPARQTLPVAIALLRGQHQVPWGEVLAAAVVTTAPAAILVLLWQRRIVAGLTAGALKQ